MRRARWLGLIIGFWFLVFAIWCLGQMRKNPDQTPNTIAGQVREGDKSVEGVRVRWKGTATETVTDAEGHFRLPSLSSEIGTLTAWKEGFFIGSTSANQPPRTIDLTRLPANDNEEYQWVDPGPDPRQAHRCANCHGTIYEEWSASAHAHSVDNRHFLNLYDGSDWNGRPGRGWNLLAEHPDGSGVCSSCHAPTAALDDPAYYNLPQLRGVAARGVHCDYCHKVTGTVGKVGLTHGRFGLQLLRPAEGQLFFGPLDDVDRGEDAYSPLYQQSRYCASCHEGTVFGVHVYSTYTEWLASPARTQGKQCQTCHMTPTGTLTNIAPGKGGIERNPQGLANHRFFAGSQLDMLRQCLKMSVRIFPGPDGLSVEVTLVAEEVGHRVPTGFVDHHLLLVVQAFDRSGQPARPAQGDVLPALAGKDLEGVAGRLYGTVMHDFEGRSPTPFWHADSEYKDTRLVPGQGERVAFGFPAGVISVRVRLLHRRSWQELAAVKGWPDNEEVVAEQTLQSP
jgi:hypothetical protein